MEVRTTRFGKLDIDPGDAICFPSGIMGLHLCREWVLIADPHHQAVSWLQSVSRFDVALAVVSPRRFVPGYQLLVPKSELAPLALARVQDAEVLAIVSRDDRGSFTINLKAPLVLNLEQRLGRQIVSSGEQSLQHLLTDFGPAPLRKSA